MIDDGRNNGLAAATDVTTHVMVWSHWDYYYLMFNCITFQRIKPPREREIVSNEAHVMRAVCL